MEKTFVYAKADGTMATRNVYVIAEDDGYIRGLDLDKLTESQKSSVRKNLANHKVSSTVSFEKGRGAVIDGFDTSWNVAWRTFKKSNIR